ncbi:MAG: squalene/phytoene synthase family protein, partial [Methylocella sp.]
MTPGLPMKPSKTHGQENFPVASVFIAPKHRATILAYYRFARGADDVADNPLLAPDAKLAGLDLFEATLTGQCDTIEAALPLRAALALRKLSPRHALDLLRAFRMDAVKHRYANWSELMDYCAYSAAPVGRFVLDVHGESESTWPASDALCTALQIINHLQDCGADYRNLDRVYV